jgi:hypothetical protein
LEATLGAFSFLCLRFLCGLFALAESAALCSALIIVAMLSAFACHVLSSGAVLVALRPVYMHKATNSANAVANAALSALLNFVLRDICYKNE